MWKLFFLRPRAGSSDIICDTPKNYPKTFSTAIEYIVITYSRTESNVHDEQHVENNTYENSSSNVPNTYHTYYTHTRVNEFGVDVGRKTLYGVLYYKVCDG